MPTRKALLPEQKEELHALIRLLAEDENPEIFRDAQDPREVLVERFAEVHEIDKMKSRSDKIHASY